VTRLHQTWRIHRAIIAAVQLSFRAWVPWCIFKRGQLKVEWCTFWPSVKITEGVGEISGSINEALATSLQPNLRNTLDGHPLRGCWAQCIGKKESSAAFIQGHPTYLSGGLIKCAISTPASCGVGFISSVWLAANDANVFIVSETLRPAPQYSCHVPPVS